MFVADSLVIYVWRSRGDVNLDCGRNLFSNHTLNVLFKREKKNLFDFAIKTFRKQTLNLFFPFFKKNHPLNAILNDIFFFFKIIDIYWQYFPNLPLERRRVSWRIWLRLSSQSHISVQQQNNFIVSQRFLNFKFINEEQERRKIPCIEWVSCNFGEARGLPRCIQSPLGSEQ